MKQAWIVVGTVVAVLSSPSRSAAQIPTQSVKVHGYWVIEVRNPDGTLVRRRAFENALSEPGKLTLANLLNRNVNFTFWQIQIDGLLCNNGAGTPIQCLIVEPNGPSGPYIFENLTKSVVGSTFVLQGNFVAAFDGAVSRVGTYTMPIGLGFTATLLSPTIPVQATQSVSVTVTISFS